MINRAFLVIAGLAAADRASNRPGPILFQRLSLRGGGDGIIWESTSNYEVLGEIGSGKYSFVFEAIRISDNETVALKVWLQRY